MDQGLNRKPNGWALLPFLIFIVIYLGPASSCSGRG